MEKRLTTLITLWGCLIFGMLCENIYSVTTFIILSIVMLVSYIKQIIK